MRWPPRGVAWLPPVVAALASLAVYACTPGGTYIFDDVAIVHEDPRVLAPSRWGELWTRPYFDPHVVNTPDKLYRPLMSTSFAIEYSLHGDRPWAFHLVNLLLQMGVAAAVAALGVRLGGLGVGWIAGLLFAVHPVHVEAVAGLVGRCELACALATIVGILLFLRDGPLSAGRIAAIWACFVIALLSKEQGILFPLLLLAAAPLRRSVALPEADRPARLALIAVLCWTLAAYFLVRERIAPLFWSRSLLDWDVNPMVRSVGRDRLLMPLVLLGRYAALLVFPRKLSIDYGAMVIGWKVNPHDPYLYLGTSVALIWLMATIVSLARRRYAMLFCLISIAVCYLMVGNVISLIGTIFGERLIYLPSVFFVIAAALAMARLPTRVAVPLVVIVALLGAARTYTYARRWNDRVQFYEYNMAVQPRSERIYSLLWNEYEDLGDWTDASRVAELARVRLPECWQSYAMCVDCDLARGDLNAADAAAGDGLAHYKDIERFFLFQRKEIIAQRRAATHQSR